MTIDERNIIDKEYILLDWNVIQYIKNQQHSHDDFIQSMNQIYKRYEFPFCRITSYNVCYTKLLRITFLSAAAFFSKLLSICFAYSCAIRSFSRTFPERYSEASS